MDLINNGYLYVDKTEYIYQLVKIPKGEYFFSRPRRFGKSLTVSTLDALFRGKKELFRDLYIYDRYDFEEYPVIHIDFSGADTTSTDTFNEWLMLQLKTIAREYGVEPEGSTPSIRFSEMLRLIYEKSGRGIVILIDEYDNPVTSNIEDAEKAEELRKIMELFFQQIKTNERMFRFIFITGITRLAHLSIFSKLNNLEDISRDESYAGMVGYSEDELQNYFAEYIREGAEHSHMTEQELLTKMKYWYDGFCFCPNGEKVYNPVSIGSFFKKNYAFRNYWFATATPEMVVQQAKKQRLTLADVENAQYTDDEYMTFDVMMLSQFSLKSELLIQLLFQTGYLTIGERVEGMMEETWKLVYPNYEVKKSFEVLLASLYMDTPAVTVNKFVRQMNESALNGDAETMVRLLQDAIASVPYDIHLKHEKYYESLMYLLFRVCGMDVDAEKRTNHGRIDAVLHSGKYIYIIECKFNKSPETAMEQIEDRGYADAYRLEEGKEIIKIGLSFMTDDENRNLTIDYIEKPWA